MDLFLKGQITSPVFCDEYYYSYDLEIDDETLSEKERLAFSELGKVSSRFSQFKEDHERYPNAFFTEKELRDKIIETKQILQVQNPL